MDALFLLFVGVVGYASGGIFGVGIAYLVLFTIIVLIPEFYTKRL